MGNDKMKDAAPWGFTALYVDDSCVFEGKPVQSQVLPTHSEYPATPVLWNLPSRQAASKEERPAMKMILAFSLLSQFDLDIHVNC